MILILTVGTGTAGKYSNLAQGLINTIALQKPSAYRLIPSDSPDSRTIADLVREETTTSPFLPWNESEPYLPIAHHDSIADCRATVRRVIQAARAAAPDTPLLVNPTSGTKQMSAGATLAALDENIASISFTIGKRSDGVVMTGTEAIETFDPSTIFFERDFTLATQLAASGAFSAAAQILAPHTANHPAAAHTRDTCLCLHDWERLDYESARQIAARSTSPALAPLRSHLQTLAQTKNTPSPLLAADILATAQNFLARHDPETSLFYSCKALEIALRHLFLTDTGLTEPYPLEKILDLPLSDDTRRRLRAVSKDQKTSILGLRQVAEILERLGNPTATTFLQNKTLQTLIFIRNEMTHAIRSVTTEEAATLIRQIKTLFPPLPTCPPFQNSEFRIQGSESRPLPNS